jgi:hypothetical protein
LSVAFFGPFHELGFAGGLLDTMTGMRGLSVALAMVLPLNQLRRL